MQMNADTQINKTNVTVIPMSEYLTYGSKFSNTPNVPTFIPSSISITALSALKESLKPTANASHSAPSPAVHDRTIKSSQPSTTESIASSEHRRTLPLQTVFPEASSMTAY